MPQMKPMNWLILMMYFLLSYILINTHLYYIYSEKNNEMPLLKKKMFKYNLKW